MDLSAKVGWVERDETHQSAAIFVSLVLRAQFNWRLLREPERIANMSIPVFSDLIRAVRSNCHVG